MDTLGAEDIHALAEAGESQTVEFKLEQETQPDISELLIAFANAEGGVVLFGVTDEGAIVGLQRPNAVQSRLIAAARACRPPLTPYLVSYPVTVDSQVVLVGQVLPVGDQIYSFAGVYRRREGADNAAMTAEEMKYLILARMSQDFDSQPLDLDLTALDPVLADRLLAQRVELMVLRGGEGPATPAQFPTPATLEQLEALYALVRVRDVLRPTVAGLLMLGRAPQQTLPQAIIRAAAYADDGASVFLDRAEIDGPLPEQLRRALAFVTRNMRLGAVILGAERVEQPQYPLVAVREALVNALIHRSYGATSPIFVNLFPARLEILSPGGLLPGLRTQNLEGKHLLRNHALGPMAYFARLAETWGTGIRRIRAAMQAQGLPAPEFLDEGSWLRLTLYSQEPAPQVPLVPRQGRSASPAVLPGRRTDGLNARQRDLLNEWEQTGQGSIGRLEYQQRYDVTAPTAGRDLQQLVQQGTLEQVGRGWQTRYRYIPRAPSAPPVPAAAPPDQTDEEMRR